jgi:hypothetical protein
MKARPMTQETLDRYRRAMSYLHKKADAIKDVPGKKSRWKKIHARRNRLNTQKNKYAGPLFDRGFTADMLLKGAMSKRR